MAGSGDFGFGTSGTGISSSSNTNFAWDSLQHSELSQSILTLNHFDNVRKLGMWRASVTSSMGPNPLALEEALRPSSTHLPGIRFTF